MAGNNGVSSSRSPRAVAADTRRPRVAIVVSRYNATITDRLLAAAVAAFHARLGPDAPLEILHAPGAYELPALAAAAARAGRFEGVLALGCLIKGDTRHDEFIAHAVAQGLVNITIATGVPCAFGVLTVNTTQQALDRAGGRDGRSGKHGNKGQEAMDALLDTIEQIQRIASGSGGNARSSSRAAPTPDKLARRPRSRRSTSTPGGRGS